jgi:hypothetical protein
MGWEYLIVVVGERRENRAAPPNGGWHTVGYATTIGPDGETASRQLWAWSDTLRRHTEQNVSLPEILSELGSDGWEMVAATPRTADLDLKWSRTTGETLYFKRAIPS